MLKLMILKLKIKR